MKNWNLPMGWELVTLRDILFKLESGRRPKGGVGGIDKGILSIGGEHVSWDGTLNLSSPKYIDIDFFNSMKSGIINDDDILIVKDGATTGKVAHINQMVSNQPMAVNEHVFICRVNRIMAVSKYVFYHLKSKNGLKQILNSYHGAAQGGINSSFVDNYLLPLPPLETQHKIVAILDKAEEIKRLRAEANAQTQKLIQSVFMDMFGDPVKNTKHFEKRRVGDLVDSIEKVDSSLLDQFHYIDIDSVDNCLNIVSNPKIVTGIEAPSRARQLVKKDDILFSTVRPYLKNIAIVPEYLDGQVASTGFCILRSKTPECVPFLFHLLLSNSFVDSLKEFYRGANYPAISPKDLMDYHIPFPSIDLLVKFNSRSRQIDTNLKYQSKFLNEITRFDELLMSKAFTGELVA